jgi:hypothetical protein
LTPPPDFPYAFDYSLSLSKERVEGEVIRFAATRL